MVTNAPPSMRADDVRRDMRDQKRKREAVYDTVLAFIHRSILKRADVGAVRMSYDVPLIVVGKPVIKVGDCVRYVLSALQGDGYTVRFTFPKSVYVSWDSDERRSAPRLSPADISSISAGVDSVFSRARPRGASSSAVSVLPPSPVPPLAPPPGPAVPPPSSPSSPSPLAIGVQSNLPAARAPDKLLPWEAFEGTQPMRALAPGLSLLPPPLMTITNVREVSREPRCRLPTQAPTTGRRAPSSRPREDDPDGGRAARGSAGAVTVADVGRNGGLVLNL